MEFYHDSTAYILRWNTPDYKAIIGVFSTEKHLNDFIQFNYTPDEQARIHLGADNWIIETGRHYRPRWS